MNPTTADQKNIVHTWEMMVIGMTLFAQLRNGEMVGIGPLSVSSERLSVNSEKLSVNSEKLSVSSEKLSMSSENGFQDFGVFLLSSIQEKFTFELTIKN